MNLIFISLFCMAVSLFQQGAMEIPAHLKQVDQVIWVVDDIDNTINNWKKLGFDQVVLLDTAEAQLKGSGKKFRLRIALANLGGANITWIQPVDKSSIFYEFHQSYGDGAMSLVHRLENGKSLKNELKRLKSAGVVPKEETTIFTNKGNLKYVFMDTRNDGKYYLGYTYGDVESGLRKNLSAQNLHQMKINQYAFAAIDYKNISAYWTKIGLPEFKISHPELGSPKYYGKPADHELIQGWQRHGTIAYEWCIPIKPPTVYADHIKKHGEGIHHLAFSVNDMDKVLNDYTSKGYIVSMGGTWGETGKPGSGRYEYIDLENAGGLTIELLWNYP